MTDQEDKNKQQLEESREGFVLGLMLIIVKALTDKGVNNAAAVLIAMDIIKGITVAFGATTIYLPKRDSVRHAEKAAAIVAEFDGKNHQELAEKHGLSTVWIYQLIKRGNEKEPKKPDVAGIAAILKARGKYV